MKNLLFSALASMMLSTGLSAAPAEPTTGYIPAPAAAVNLTVTTATAGTAETPMAYYAPKWWWRFKLWLWNTYWKLRAAAEAAQNEQEGMAMINETEDGGTLFGAVRIDFAYLDQPEAASLGITVTETSITFAEHLLVNETPLKQSFIVPGTYPIADVEGESIAEITYLIRDKN